MKHKKQFDFPIWKPKNPVDDYMSRHRREQLDGIALPYMTRDFPHLILDPKEFKLVKRAFSQHRYLAEA